MNALADRPLNRFLHLERARPEGRGPAPGHEPPTPGAERFAGVERPLAGGPSPATHTGVQLGRFGPEPEPTLELLDTAGRPAFTRCMRCGGDSNVLLTECPNCGADLNAPAQRAFGERFWAERQAQDAREARAEAEREEVRRRAADEEARARRSMGEALAREVGEAERRRLDADGLPGGDLGGGGFRWGGGGWAGDGTTGSFDPTPIGLRLLRLIPDPRWQWGALGAALVLVLGLVGYGLAGGAGHRGPWLALGIAVAVLLVSPGGWSRWRRWW